MVANNTFGSLGLRRLIMSSRSKKDVISMVDDETPYIKNKFSAILPYKKAHIFLGSKDSNLITAELIKPKPLSWYVVQDDKCLAFIHIKVIADEIYGDAIPLYYKNKEAILIELTSNSDYEEVDIELVKAAVRESQRLGLYGRAYVKAALTDTLYGSSIPFYNKLGFKCVNRETDKLIENCIKENERIPTNCNEVFMYLPKEILPELFESNYN